MWCLLAATGFAASGCTHTVRPDIGVKSYGFALDADESVCVNVSVYPFSIVFGDFGSDTIYKEYDYWPPKSGSVTSFETLMRFLPAYRTMMDPEHSITITAKSPTSLTFMTAQLPGMCHDGTYFSSSGANTLTFGRNQQGFFNLDVYSDKCVVFGPLTNMTVKVRVESEDQEDQVFVHDGFTEFVSIGGNETLSREYGSDEAPFFRIVADDLSPAELVEIVADVTAPVRIPMSAVYIPKRPAQKCEQAKLWYNEKVAIGMIVLTAGVGAIFLGFLCIVSIRQRGVHHVGRGMNIWSGEDSDSRSWASMTLIE